MNLTDHDLDRAAARRAADPDAPEIVEIERVRRHDVISFEENPTRWHVVDVLAPTDADAVVELRLQREGADVSPWPMPYRAGHRVILWEHDPLGLAVLDGVTP